MGNNLRHIFCALTLFWPGLVAAQTGDAATPTKGSVILLPNDRIMEGDIERVGDQYRIRRDTGETWLTADKVRRLCESREGAYTYLRSQANLHDADERLRLARWCQLHGLRSQALAEAQAAQRIRPRHAETVRLVRTLERALAVADNAVAPADTKQEV